MVKPDFQPRKGEGGKGWGRGIILIGEGSLEVGLRMFFQVCLFVFFEGVTFWSLEFSYPTVTLSKVSGL